MTNTLIDNTPPLILANTLREIITNPCITEICVATGYWDIPGLALLESEMESFLQRDGAKLRILIGSDPYLFAQYNREPKYKSAKEFPEDFIRTDIHTIEVIPEYENAVSFLLKWLPVPEKLEVRIFKHSENEKTHFLHAKCWILTDKKEKAFGIIGSSNFTKKGLRENAELNYLETNWTQIMPLETGSALYKTHLQWFNEMWENSIGWSETFLEQILRPSRIAQAAAQKKKADAERPELTPYENYIKLLQDKFGMITDANFKAILESYLPVDITPLEYQLNAVQQCWANMLSHGGFVLGDVVGLGKTVVGILLIKYFIETAKQHGRGDKVLVIVPPAIRSSWKDTTKKFDKNQSDKIESHVTFITTGSLGNLNEHEFGEESEFGVEVTDDDMDDAQEFDFDSDSDENGNSKKEKSAELSGFSKDFSQSKTNYGLVVIDESHKFRNSGTQMYAALTDYLEGAKARTGAYPFVGLLSATMQNNSPNDIKNQIYLFEHEPKNSSFEKVPAKDLEHFFSEVNKKYNELIHKGAQQAGVEQAAFAQKDDAHIKAELIALSKEVREKVLSDILVRRTRTDIKKHYGGSLQFPAVHGPENLFYTMDNELAALFSDTMNIIAPNGSGGDLFDENGLGYYRYRATMYLSEKFEKRYSGRNMTARRSSNQLARIMQILLVKRLESSFKAFKESLRNFQRYTENMITMWEHDAIFICPQIDVNAELNIAEKQAKNPEKVVTLESCFDDIRAKIEKLNKDGRNEKAQNAEYKQSDFRAGDKGEKSYIDCLKSDLQKIKSLVERWNKNDYDPKLDRFKIALQETNGFFSAERNKPHKLVIFSEAITTVQSLRRAVKNITHKEPLVITAKNRTEMESVIKENFDANCEVERQKNDYDVIITTEVLAEGINLHRANTILNYDTPWNATRLIQRIGRVNRIGSPNSDIYVYNFYPSTQGDEQINLVKNAYTKLQSFHTMFGEDSKIFSQEEELSEGNFEALVDGEESPQEKYIAELKSYRAQNPERYAFIEKLPCGEIKSLATVAADKTGSAFFAVKSKNKHGSVYVKIQQNGEASIINYMDMLEQCRCQKNAPSLPLPADMQNLQRLAIQKYNEYENKLQKAKAAKVNVTSVLIQIQRFMESGTLTTDTMRLLGNASRSIKDGNSALAKRLGALLSTMESERNSLVPVTTAEIEVAIQRELGNIAQKVQSENGESVIFAGFYFA